MAQIAKKTKRYPSDLTDEEWKRLAPLMPRPGRRGRPREVDEAGEVGGAAVVACCEPAKMLEAAKASLDPVAMLVDGGVVRDEDIGDCQDFRVWAGG